MEWIEVDLIPEACIDCQEGDCYNCDIAGERWQLSHEDVLRVRRKQLVKAVERLQREINAIDMELLPFTDEQRAALGSRRGMTYDLFWACLQVCFEGDNMILYREIWEDYPNYSKHIKQHIDK